MFILPLLKPRRLLKRLMRLPTHPWVLRFWLFILPRRVTSFFGLTQDAQTGKPILRLPASLTRSSNASSKERRKFANVPRHVCAICYEREEARQSGIGAVGRDAIRAGIPSSDPLDPSANTLAPSRTANPSASSAQARPALPRSRSSSSTSTAALRGEEPTVSSTGIAYATCTAHTPYVVPCCGASYCYICIASVLLSEQAAEELEDSAEDAASAAAEGLQSSSPASPRSPASGSRSPSFNSSKSNTHNSAFGDSSARAWTCLRCAEGIRSARRRDGREPVWREAKRSASQRSFSSSADDDDDEEEELDLSR